MGRSYEYVQRQQRIINERIEEQKRRQKYGSGKREIENQRNIEGMQQQIKALQNQKNAAPAKPTPKPKGDQQIDPVQHSPEVSAAQKIANNYMDGLKDKKSPWAQAQSDANSSSNFGNFNPGGDKTSTPDAQNFADKYKLDLISSGATKQNQTDFTAGDESSMSSADILRRDKELYGT